MAKPGAVQKGKRDFGAVFQETLTAAMKNAPPPGAVQRFKEMLDVCREHGVTPWRDQAGPLLGAAAVVLIKDAAFMPEAVAALWAEHVRDMRESLGHEDAPPLEKMLLGPPSTSKAFTTTAAKWKMSLPFSDLTRSG